MKIRRATVSLTIMTALLLTLGSGLALAASFAGTSGNDTILGTRDSDRAFGLQGSDRLFGYGGRDILDGGANDDLVHGGFGNDLLRGGKDQDMIVGGPGHDRINSADGDRDTVRCGTGRDKAIVDATDIVDRTCEAVVVSERIREGM